MEESPRIGDRVWHPNRPKTHSAGRVTGFSPIGSVRVMLDNGQQRIWPHADLCLFQEQDDHVRQYLFYIEVREFVERIGEHRAARLVAMLEH